MRNGDTAGESPMEQLLLLGLEIILPNLVSPLTSAVPKGIMPSAKQA
jgi:hypothetical protein